MHLRCWLVVAFWIFVGAAEAQPSWQAAWDEGLEAAKQEGKVVLYGANQQDHSGGVAEKEVRNG